MPDRPDDVQRMERARRLRALVAEGTLTGHDVDAVWTYFGVCERLARAEQSLADIEALHTIDRYGNCVCCGEMLPCRTIYALRASQGGAA